MTDQLTPNEAIIDRQDDEDSSTPWPTDDVGVIALVRECRNKAESVLGDWYEQAAEDFRFREGKQWSDDDVEKLEEENRVAAVFNRVGPVVNAILGQEVANRQEVKFLRRRVGEVSMADPMNDAIKWVREQCNAEDEDSDAFGDMVTCGMGWTCTRMNYEDNPDGMPEVERRDPLSMRWDVSARRKNLADAKWVQSDYWMDEDEIEARWPDADIEGDANLRTPNDRKDPHNAQDAWLYKNDQSAGDSYDGKLRVVHHVNKYLVTKYRVVDPATQQLRELSQDEYRTVLRNAKAVGQQLMPAVPVKVSVYWHAWVVGGSVLESGQAPVQKGFTYQCMTAQRERESGYWYGVVRMMVDPQRYANRFMSLMMSVLATGPKGGMLFETGAFANPKRAKADWARHDSAIEVTPGSLAGGKIQPKPPIQMPAGAADLMQFAITSIRDVVGFGPEMLGQAVGNEKNAEVEDMRIKSGLTILAPIFDSIRLYRKRHGLLLAEFVEKFISDGRLVRVLGQQGQQFIPLLRDPEGAEYDVIVDESPTSRDVKEKTWNALQIIAPMAMQAGMPLPPSLLDYAPLPQSLVQEWKQAIGQAQQQQQPNPEMMKAQAHMQVEQMKAQVQAQTNVQLAQMKAQADHAIQQARAQADVQVKTAEAQLSAATERAKDQSQMQLEQMRAEMQKQTSILTAIINQIGKVETARVSAQMDTGEQFVTAAAYPQ